MTDTMTRPPEAPSSAPAPIGVTQRRRQAPWAALGVLMIAGSMLGFALWSSSQSTRQPILVAASTIDAGTIVTEADLTVASVAIDGDIAHLDAADAHLVVGEVARGPIPAGTPLSAELVTTGDAVPAGHVVVGALLSPGEYPTSALRAGDQVEVVGTGGGLVISTAPVDGGGAATTAATVSTAAVWSVETIHSSSEPKLFVSLLVPDADAAAVADLLDQNRVRLVLIGADQ